MYKLVTPQTTSFPSFIMNKKFYSHAHLDEAIHVCLNISYGHPLHDNVHDAALQGLPLLTGRLGETAGSAGHSGGAQASWLPLQLLPVAGRGGKTRQSRVAWKRGTKRKGEEENTFLTARGQQITHNTQHHLIVIFFVCEVILKLNMN